MKKTKVLSLFAASAMLLGTTAVMPASAVDTTPMPINKPYANITAVDENGNAVTGLDLSLTSSHGINTANWTTGSEADAVIDDRLSLLNSSTDLSTLRVDSKYISIDDYRGDIAAKDIENIEIVNQNGENFRGEYLRLNEQYTVNADYYYEMEGVDLTVPAGTYQVIVDEAYNQRAYSSQAEICYLDDENFRGNLIAEVDFKSNAGKTVSGNLDVGFYDLYLGRYVGSCDGGTAGCLQIYDKPTDYVRVTLNVADASNNYFNADGTCTYERSNGDTETFDLKGSGDQYGNNVYYFFKSGAVINAAIPDANGNITVYLCKEDYKLYYTSGFDSASGWSGGGINGYTYSYQKPMAHKTFAIFDTSIEIPESGLTLYNIAPDTYDVSLDSEEYELETASITIEDTKNLQNIVIKVKSLAEDSSSEEESSSEADSSSEVDSSSESDSSSEASTSSDAASSAADSSSAAGTASKTDSKTSSAASGGTTKNDANPNTGVVSGAAAALVLLGGAAVTAVKKKSGK